MPDGTGIVIAELAPGAEWTLLLLSLEGDRGEKILLRPSDVNRGATLSPDGRYIAYDSGPNGDVYVRPFPEVDAERWILSSGGRSSPQWVEGGRRILYRGPNAIMAVDVETDSGFAAGPARPIVEAPSLVEHNWPARTEHSMAVMDNGKRIIVLADEPVADSEQRAQQIVVVTHWLDELERLVPTKE